MTRSVSGRNTLLSRGLIRAVVIEKAAGGGGYGKITTMPAFDEAAMEKAVEAV